MSARSRAVKGARVVREKDFVAVVADHEWDACAPRACSRSRGTKRRRIPSRRWRSSTTHPQGARGEARRLGEKSDVEGVFKTAARVVEAEYEWPFQSHASMGPACAVADVRRGWRHRLDRLAEAALRPDRGGAAPRRTA